MGSSIFGIGVSGLNAANLGLTTTGHNIANAKTAGYSRQSVIQSAPYPQLSGSGYVGMGTKVDTIVRSYDQFLTRQVMTTQAKSSYYDSYLQHMQDIDNIVADSSAGVSPALQSYFSAVQNAATNPSNVPARQALLSAAQTLVNRFQTFEQRLTEMSDSVNGEISSTADSINAIAKQIADINGQIVLSSGMGQPPNDLLDKRDEMVKDLNKLVRATTVSQTDGSINVFIGSGQNLVVGQETFNLAAVPSPSDPQRTTVVYQQNGNTVYLSEDALDGGKLGGLLAFRSKSLDLAQSSLAKVALGLAETFNAQHKAGMDLDGNMGQNFFKFDLADSVTLNNQFGGGNYSFSADNGVDPSSDFTLNFDGTNYTLTRLSDKSSVGITAAQMAAGYTSLGVTVQLTGGTPTTSGSISMAFPPAIGGIAPRSSNTGTGTLTGYISNIDQLQNSSSYDLSYDGANYILTRQSDGQKTSYAGGTISVDGMTLTIGGTWSVGDRQTIKPYDGLINELSVGITDARDVAIAAPIRMTTNAANTGSAKFEQPLVNSPVTGSSTASINPAFSNPVTIQFTSATTFTATDTVTGAVTTNTYTAGMNFSMNGWSMKMDGSPANGDVFSIGANVAGSEDNRNGLALAKLQTTKLLSGGTATYQDSYGQMVAAIGTQTNEAKIMADAQETMLEQAETTRDSVSAVNLDEEAANLLRYQQAYQACSKVIQVAQQAFQEILDII